jgi:predicted NBD/HSP70 family sugar kinase
VALGPVPDPKPDVRWRKTPLASTPKLDPARLREENRRVLLNIIWSEREISRAELARETGLARSTVSAIAAELLATHLVVELGAGDSSGGRRPIVLGFNDEAFGLVGIDMGATHVGVAVTNLRGQVRAWLKRPLDVREDPEGAIALIDTLIADVLGMTSWTRSDLLGIGLAAPCPIDPADPDQLSTIVLPSWRNHDLVGYLRKTYGLPVYLDNDANLGALAELWWGAGIDCDDLAFLKLATGVGGGFVVAGSVYRGAAGIAGEVGHLVIDPEGALCMCGMRGCLVTQVGTVALVSHAEHLLSMGIPSTMRRGYVSLASILDAVRTNDAVACDVVRRAGRQLGVAIANLLNLMNPDRVVLSGGLTRAGPTLTEPLEEMLRGRALFSARAKTQVLISELGASGVAVGAATQVLAALLDETLETRTLIIKEAS